LQSSAFDTLTFVSAFAKVGPLLRLQPLLTQWRRAKKLMTAIIGADCQGTSIQALDFALTHFDKTYILQAGPGCTFHPKIYAFQGSGSAVVSVGSHNLTVGGTELNFEAGARFAFDLPADTEAFRACTESGHGAVRASRRVMRWIIAT